MPWTDYSFPESRRATQLNYTDDPIPTEALAFFVSVRDFGDLVSMLETPFMQRRIEILSDNTVGCPLPEIPAVVTPPILPEWRKLSREIG